MNTPPDSPIENRIRNKFGSIFLMILGSALLALIILAATVEPPDDQKYKRSTVVVFNSGDQECFNGATATIWDNFVRVSPLPADSLTSRTFPQRRVHEVTHREHPCK